MFLRLTIATALLAAMFVAPPAESVTINAEYIHATGQTTKDSHQVFDQLTSFLTVVQNEDGSRYLIIDHRAKDAPEAEVIIDGGLFDEYTHIDVIPKQ